MQNYPEGKQLRDRDIDILATIISSFVCLYVHQATCISNLCTMGFNQTWYIASSWAYLVLRKPVFGISEQPILKSAC